MTEKFGDPSVVLSDPYLKIEVSEPHQRFFKTFNGVRDAVQWVNDEISFWDQARSRVVKILDQNGIPNVTWQGAVFDQLTAFQRAVTANQAGNETIATPDTIAARDALANSIARGDVILRDSTVGDRVLGLEASQPLAFAVATTAHSPNVTFLKVSNRNSQDKPWSVKQVLDGYRARYPTQLSEVEGQGGALATRVNELEGLLAKARATDAAITQLAETLRQKIATEKAVEVWKDRITTHASRVDSAMQHIVITFAAIMVVIVALLASLRPGGWLSGLVGASALDIWTRTVLLGIPIVAAIWIIRMLTVKYRISLAGAEDASERVAMVETLYALSAESKTAPNETERMLVMSALFRPGPSRDHDPSLPSTLIEQAAKLAVRDPRSAA